MLDLAMARGPGLKKVVSTDPDLPAISMPVELQKRLAERGIFFERTLNVSQSRSNTLDVARLVARIREVSYAQTIMATDFGQPDTPHPGPPPSKRMGPG